MYNQYVVSIFHRSMVGTEKANLGNSEPCNGFVKLHYSSMTANFSCKPLSFNLQHLVLNAELVKMHKFSI